MRKVTLSLAFLLIATALAYPQRVSFKLMGGLTWINGDDYNKGIVGQNQYLKATTTSMSGAYEKLSSGLKFQAEVINYLNPRMGIGLGGGYFRTSNESKVTSHGLLVDVPYDNESTYNAKVSVIPFFLNFHYLARPAPKLRLDLFAGPVFSIVQFNFQNPSVTPTSSTTETVAFTASIAAIGLQGGLGLNFEITPNIALVADGSFRYGKVSNIKGNWSDIVNSPSGTTVNSNAEYYLWYYENTQGGSYPQIGFYDKNGPTAGSISGARKADINLSGLVILAGIKFSI
jgi:hypothetical protein